MQLCLIHILLLYVFKKLAISIFKIDYYHNQSPIQSYDSYYTFLITSLRSAEFSFPSGFPCGGNDCTGAVLVAESCRAPHVT